MSGMSQLHAPPAPPTQPLPGPVILAPQVTPMQVQAQQQRHQMNSMMHQSHQQVALAQQAHVAQQQHAQHVQHQQQLAAHQQSLHAQQQAAQAHHAQQQAAQAQQAHALQAQAHSLVQQQQAAQQAAQTPGLVRRPSGNSFEERLAGLEAKLKNLEDAWGRVGIDVYFPPAWLKSGSNKTTTYSPPPKARTRKTKPAAKQTASASTSTANATAPPAVPPQAAVPTVVVAAASVPAAAVAPQAAQQKDGHSSRKKTITYSCVFCRSRHQSCDGGRPACERCREHDRECEYVERKKHTWTKAKRKSHVSKASAPSSSKKARTDVESHVPHVQQVAPQVAHQVAPQLAQQVALQVAHQVAHQVSHQVAQPAVVAQRTPPQTLATEPAVGMDVAPKPQPQVIPPPPAGDPVLHNDPGRPTPLL
jgi:Fungal Zn(2)-Cys(6) binuclear cluster domain